ncbi:hypothetical protein [Paraburkholderia caballeronis]|uniref:Uncharacterized protein n=1 Tax=Paraburkholderia caballeronis TaxID=416943 RepID=A0A1H7SGG3_9BURK|nr:hypothetical protein [Paraburkholderia caballeronis]PXW22293.1 hypothetical protein C7403_11517 [Paraburkholderia caballeronis]PXW95952.1 hypothetical protein C7407_11517 [Paraburkholderia caballeronis]RAJ92318.1 hypothetical protein C7409_11517 [Paraburkholderia caballeronis]SEB52807.1 hypothetical protein SAMN05445871_0456 [Paraburkholderia caballeronis]SEL71595.1 hypothetical protein SAMN05192542_11217 [Paraburkholderia caballeronis]
MRSHIMPPAPRGTSLVPPPRVITDEAFAARVIDSYHQRAWPSGLVPLKLFARKRDKGECFYRAVTWDAHSRDLYVLRLVAGSGTLYGGGDWERWNIDGADDPLGDVYSISDIFTPPEIQTESVEVRASSLVGLERRKSIVKAYSEVTVDYNGKPTDMFNPFILSDPKARSEALYHVLRSMGQQPGYQSTILEYFHRHCAYGGRARALIRQTKNQGGLAQQRIAVNVRRPGPKTRTERIADDKTEFLGHPRMARKTHVRPLDFAKFVEAIEKYYIGERMTLANTYSAMVSDQYSKYPERLIPSWKQFLYHVNRYILAKTDAKRRQLGRRLSRKYLSTKSGQATHLTLDMSLEIVDVDGFVAKVPVAGLIAGKIEPIFVTIIFAVSRRTGAVVGYEIAMEGEDNESFRRCIASIYIDKTNRARELGLRDTKDLLHGSIDGVFVDNGAGGSDEVIEAACKESHLIMYLAPPAAGDRKGTGESLNGIMLRLMAEARGAYTRQRDFLSLDLRDRARKEVPITVEQLEELLLVAIQHVNRFSKKRHLRSETMRMNGCHNINPTTLWEYHQAARIGDQKVELTEQEAWERFIPWKPGTVRGGKLAALSKRWRSDELDVRYDDFLRCRSGKSDKMKIEYKRVGNHATTLLWRDKQGNRGELELVPEDALMVEVVTWKALELRNWDDAALTMNDEVKKGRHRHKINTLTNKAQKKLDDHQRRSNKTPETVLEGETTRKARKNGKVRQDAARFARAKGALANVDEALEEFEAVKAEVFLNEDGTVIIASDFDDEYDDILASQLLAASQRRHP